LVVVEELPERPGHDLAGYGVVDQASGVHRGPVPDTVDLRLVGVVQDDQRQLVVVLGPDELVGHGLGQLVDRDDVVDVHGAPPFSGMKRPRRATGPVANVLCQSKVIVSRTRPIRSWIAWASSSEISPPIASSATSTTVRCSMSSMAPSIKSTATARRSSSDMFTFCPPVSCSMPVPSPCSRGTSPRSSPCRGCTRGTARLECSPDNPCLAGNAGDRGRGGRIRLRRWFAVGKLPLQYRMRLKVEPNRRHVVLVLLARHPLCEVPRRRGAEPGQLLLGVGQRPVVVAVLLRAPLHERCHPVKRLDFVGDTRNKQEVPAGLVLLRVPPHPGRVLLTLAGVLGHELRHQAITSSRSLATRSAIATTRSLSRLRRLRRSAIASMIAVVLRSRSDSRSDTAPASPSIVASMASTVFSSSEICAASSRSFIGPPFRQPSAALS